MSNVFSVRCGLMGETKIAKITVEWCAEKLLPRFRTLDIEVIFRNFSVRDETLAECRHIEGNEFEIHIQKGMKVFDLISALCHEMVHVKQYVRKELRDVYAGRKKPRQIGTMWKKSPRNWVKVNYEEQPWEKEAYRLEKALAIECLTEAHSDF